MPEINYSLEAKAHRLAEIKLSMTDYSRYTPDAFAEHYLDVYSAILTKLTEAQLGEQVELAGLGEE